MNFVVIPKNASRIQCSSVFEKALILTLSTDSGIIISFNAVPEKALSSIFFKFSFRITFLSFLHSEKQSFGITSKFLGITIYSTPVSLKHPPPILRSELGKSKFFRFLHPLNTNPPNSFKLRENLTFSSFLQVSNAPLLMHLTESGITTSVNSRLLSSCISSFIDYMGSGLRLGGYRHNRVISVFVCMVRQFSVFYPITTSSSPGKPCHFVGQGLSNSQI